MFTCMKCLKSASVLVPLSEDATSLLGCLLQTVGLGDDLYFQRLPESADKDEFECNMDGVPTDGSNLVLRALDLFRRRTTNMNFYKVNAKRLLGLT